MSKILDQSGDVNFSELHKFAMLYDLPEFAKKAELSEIVGPDEKLSNLYADIRVPYQFPCHTKAATYISYLYFLEKQAELPPRIRGWIKERLDKFAEYWSINNAVKQATEKHAELNKEADIPDSAYAIVWVTEDGHKEKHYSMRNAGEVKAAAEWFSDYLPDIRSQYTFDDRQTIATKILSKAAEFGADIRDHVELLEKYAGRGLCEPKAAAKLVRDRVKAASKCSKEVALVMNKLASAVESRPAMLLDPVSMTQLASTVDQFDRTHGLLNRYTDMIPAPEDVLFTATYTKAAEVCSESCSLTTGSVYDLNDFSKLSTSDVQDLFGDEITEAVCSGLRIDPVKMAEVAATFPRNEAIMLEQLMSEKGVAPLAKQASTHLGFTMNQLKQLAAH